LNGQVVQGPGSLERILGPPARIVEAKRAIPGVEDMELPTPVLVWDEAGIVAAKGFVMVVIGENELDESIWPQSSLPGDLLVAGETISVRDWQLDRRYEDRYHRTIGPFQATAFTNWRQTPFKVVIEL
jgi:hypothetical protein